MRKKSKDEKSPLSKDETNVNPVYRVGLYLRLSDKDEKEENKMGISESIENQRMLLMEFIRDKPDLRLVSLFIDDGKTGTNFKRSGFEEMMEEARNGKINCIIVKDLSRFGRNYLEAGQYIEYIFPFLNIRFIAVTDGFDTLTATSAQLSYLIPLKNLMNENYARDISKKERSAKKILRKKGYFLGSYAMYGYEKTEDRHKIRIDPEAAVYVKMIFNWGEQGYSDSAIAKILNQRQIACPARYKYEKGILKHKKYANTSGWYPQTVAGILSSRMYIGDMVQGTRASKEIRGKKEVVSPDAWDIVSGTHEAIISQEQFERVQRIRLDRHKKYKEITGKNIMQMDESECINPYQMKSDLIPVEYKFTSTQKDIPYQVKFNPISTGHKFTNTRNGVLKGMVYCGDCKKAMVRKGIKGCKDKYRYICEIYERNGQCSRKFLREKDLYEMVNSLLQKQIKVACDIDVWVREKQKKEKSELSKLEQRLQENVKKREGLVRKKASFYQQWKEGIIDQEEYFSQKTCCAQDISQCEKEKIELMNQCQKYRMADSVGYFGDFTDESGEEKGEKGYLAKELVECLIERIEIYKGYRIKVYFKFMDEVVR